MRYLYGDSVPFPLSFNFLATLEIFMTTATRAVELELGALKLALDTTEAAAGRQRGIEALEQFHGVVMRAFTETAAKVPNGLAQDYTRNVSAQAQRFVDEHRAHAARQNEQEAAAARADTDRRRQEIRTHLETFFKIARLPLEGYKLSLELVDGKTQAHAVFLSSHGIVSTFTLAAGKVAAWNHPRKVSEFAPNLQLMVGVNKSWLRGTISAEKVRLDDYVVSHAELSDDACQIHLRKKVGEKDSLVFRTWKGEGGMRAEVEHPGDPNAEALPPEVDPRDLPELDRFVQALRIAGRELLEHKEQLSSVKLDGADVLGENLVIPMVERLVAMFAPTVIEIAKRSPNESELSLKTESDEGRREEIYLKKDDLVSKLQPLHAGGRQVFAPLGLDGWVPSLTVAPPAVAVVPVVVPPAPPSTPRTPST
ncbi:MAG: hypothetical protein JNL38_18785 [Myxococcales bacterium]|jgi:hypothetical protein|nr:hypothetical protein [Myxococcales bacterium]